MLLGREKEFNQIEKYLKDGLSKNKKPLSLYIGGSSGTGKTATLRLIIDKLSINESVILKDFYFIVNIIINFLIAININFIIIMNNGFLIVLK